VEGGAKAVLEDDGLVLGVKGGGCDDEDAEKETGREIG